MHLSFERADFYELEFDASFLACGNKVFVAEQSTSNSINQLGKTLLKFSRFQKNRYFL